MYPVIVEATPGEDFMLRVVFDTGEAKILDMKPYLDFGVFKRISNYEGFSKVKVAFDTVEWPCGVDLDPEFVYRKGEPVESV